LCKPVSGDLGLSPAAYHPGLRRDVIAAMTASRAEGRPVSQKRKTTMLNKASIIGNLGADPEIRSMRNGDRVANLRVATEERWKDRNSGEKKTRTTWHRVTVFGKGNVDFLEKYAGKGDTVYVDGIIRMGDFEKKVGNETVKIPTFEIHISGREHTLKLVRSAKPNGAGQEATKAAEDYGSFSPDLDDEIPF
jgi:single-strand DNA-binding protein